MSGARLLLPCVCLLLALSFVSCSKHGGEDKDAEFQKKLTGTWVFADQTPSPNRFQSLTTVDPQGNYTAHCSLLTVSNTTRTFDIEGVWLIQNGSLIDEMTNHSDVKDKTKLPQYLTNRIVQLTDKQLIVKQIVGTNEIEAAFRKEKE